MNYAPMVEPALDPPGKPWSKPRHLPHFNPGKESQMITYRMRDALPLDVARQRLAACDAEADREYRQRIEGCLDNGLGCCALKIHEYAQCILDNWRHFDGSRYHLCAWVIMLNHVHVLITLTGSTALAKIIQSWKSYTGHKLPVPWQREYWDRYIRNEEHYHHSIAYIHDNPVKAGLCATASEWKWSSLTIPGGSSAGSTSGISSKESMKTSS